jgi:arginine utilization protein RocB
MKAGLAAGLAAVEAFAAAPERVGNLLFVAVPDEEAGSAGARALAAELPGIAARMGLSLAAAINLDAMIDSDQGDMGRRVALGTVGKLLPSALVVGRAAHAAEARQGINAAALMAGIVSALEWSPALAESTDGEVAAPPTLLGLKDGRTSYDVTVPARAWAYWNVMTHRRQPADVLATFAELCREGTADGLRRLAVRDASDGLPDRVPVLTFAELRRELEGRPAAEAALTKLAETLAASGLDLPEQCRLITEQLWTASGRSGPAVIVGFASLPYLPSQLKGAAGDRLRVAVERARARIAARHGMSIGTLQYFPAISDMSFLGQVDAVGLPAVAANMPAWEHGVAWPNGLASADLPTVNAGPWGRDYHTPLERLHTAYAFDVLPDLVLEIAREVLCPQGRLG